MLPSVQLLALLDVLPREDEIGKVSKSSPGYQLRNPDEHIGFSNDPYLTGSLAAETIRGIQARGVMTSTKV